MLVLIAVHSFAISMEKAFKYCASMVLLLILSSTSMFANDDASHTLLRNNLHENAFDRFYPKNLSDNEYNFYTESLLCNDQFIKKGFISENDEEDVEHLEAKKIIPPSKSTSCHFKQQLAFVPCLLDKSTHTYSSIFFQSKTASSLYLLFEVFRI